MKKKYKLYLKLNLISLFFIVSSFIFTTLAWFAYSGLSKLDTEIDVKAWYIELTKEGETVSNNIVINLPNVYPGMNPISEEINIKNFGDSDAELSYEILSARILDNEFTSNATSLEDILSHDYPFHIDMALSDNVVLSEDGTALFTVLVSWPLDSGNDALDSMWGKEAYQFSQDEKLKKQNDSNYEIRPSIQIVINVTAEQYIESDTSSSRDYALGKTVLFNAVDNQFCSSISDTCISTTVIDTNNLIGDETITLLPNIYNDYQLSTYSNYQTTLSTITSNWTVQNRSLTISDLLKVISLDVKNSNLVINNLSDSIIGNMKNTSRINSIINKAISNNGYFTFVSNSFNYFDLSNNCIWLSDNYNDSLAFALERLDTSKSKIYGLDKNTSCKVIPVIVVKKSDVINVVENNT